MQVFHKRLFFQKSGLRIFNKPHSWLEIINYWVVDLTRLIYEKSSRNCRAFGNAVRQLIPD